MAEIILICGKICSGKGWYTRQLQCERNAVVLSCDEVENDLFHHELGDRHDIVAADIRQYLLKKAVEIVRAGCTVILDWGFWSRADRESVSACCKAAEISYEWHYVEISDEDWKRNIESRNRAVAAGETTDYAVDSGLLEKLQALFEPPTRDEIDVWFVNQR